MNEPVKCPDCGLWWRTDTHRCEEKKAEVAKPFVKSTDKKTHNARAYCLSCYKSGTVYFEHNCEGYRKTYSTTPTSTWVGYKDEKERPKHESKEIIRYENPIKKSCKCGKNCK